MRGKRRTSPGAVELYKELEKQEKTGDLFVLVNKQAKAVLYYEKHIAIKMANSDYLDAVRVMHEKLAQEDRAMDLWLQRWKNAYQYEACLEKYFSQIIHTKAGETKKISGKCIQRIPQDIKKRR
ncbi:MAG: hypothetical protein ABIQ88_04240 [Chitinophagaceae bacterium]